MADTFLDIVDENDQVIGQALRSEIHAKGLLHREIGVHFITDKGEVVFQIRGAHVDRHPNRVSAAAGGHVEAGYTHEQTALMEMFEETGVETTADQLHFLYATRKDELDEDTGYWNNVIRKVYAYVYRGKVEDLKVEDGFGGCFIAYAVNDLLNPTEAIKDQLKHYADPSRHEMYRQLQKLVS